MNENATLTRQLDIIPLESLATPITVIGAGAVGSWVAKALARMGHKALTVMDFDTVDDVNLNSQGYKLSDIGKPKVEALALTILEETGIRIEAINAKYESGYFPGIVIAAVDSMAVRKAIWESHAGKSLVTQAIIDPRMGAENALLFVVNPLDPKDIENYPKGLYSDEDALREKCTAKATIYTAYLLSGLVVKAVKDLTTNAEKKLRRVEWDIAANDVLLHSTTP
jgi:hypothetical protein